MAETTTVNAASAELGAVKGRRTYKTITRRKYLILVSLAVALVLSLLLDISVGPARLSIWQVGSTIIMPDSSGVVTRVIIWDIRMPMALMAVIVGAALAIAGAEMQTILNNPLASPFTLGISAAAGFGAALAIVLGVSVIPFAGIFLVSVNAFFFAMLASLVIYFFSRLRGVTVQTIVLLGIALVFLFTSLLALLQYIASEEALQQVVFWTLGSLVKATWPKIGIATGVLLVTTPLFIRQVWMLTALRLGDAKAQSLGVNVEKLRLQVLISTSVLAAAAVAFVGTIGFVGLVGPHVARMLVGEDQRFFLPTSAVAGAFLLSVTSIVSKSIIPGTLFPIGIVTSLVGIPFFLSLILTQRRQLW
ncbi:MAG: FecCD family ABC transporter permease [Dehalococcoidia bacterium]